MNIELEEVAVQDVSDDALEMAACGAQGGLTRLRLALHIAAISPISGVSFCCACNPLGY